jgi:PKD repeat protein
MVVAALTLASLPAGAHAASTRLHYYGGPVLHSARIVVVDWSTIPAGYPANDDGFFTTMAAASGTVGPVWAVLAEYPDTAGAEAYDWSYAGQFQIAPSVCGAPGACTINDTQIQSELLAQINAAHLPAPGADVTQTIYVLEFPAGKTIVNGTSTSGVQFCAYHGATNALYNGGHVSYVVLPDLGGNAGCGSLPAAVDNHNVFMSHEVAEQINNPLVAQATVFGPPLAWYGLNANDGEIADICVAQTALNIGWWVQKEWSNAQAACVSSGTPYFTQPTAAFTPPAAAAGQPATFTGSGTSTNTPDPQVATAAGIASYAWDFGDGATGTGASASHTYAAAGTRTVTLKITDKVGFTATVSHDLDVGDASSAGGGGGDSGGGGTTAPADAAPATTTTATAVVPGPLARIKQVAHARLLLKNGRLVLDTGRIASCAAGAGSCVVHVTVTPTIARGAGLTGASLITLGLTDVTIAPGQSVRLRVALSRARVRSLIRRGRLRATVRLLLARGTGPQQPLSLRYSLRMPKPR